MTLLIQEIFGKRSNLDLMGRHVDTVQLQWFESTRRIMRKTSIDGKELAFKLFKEGQLLQHDDVIYLDDTQAIIVEIEPCEVIVLSPASLPDMAQVCYEIGNKHAPLFLDGDELLLPPDEPLYRWLLAAGFSPYKEVRRLSHVLRSNSAHVHEDHAHPREPQFFKRAHSS